MIPWRGGKEEGEATTRVELVVRLGNRKWRRGETGEDLPLAYLFPWSDWPASSQRTPVRIGSLDKVMEG